MSKDQTTRTLYSASIYISTFSIPLFLLTVLIFTAFSPPDNCGRIWQNALEVSWLVSRLNFTWLFPHHISNLPGPLETQSHTWLILDDAKQYNFSSPVDFISMLLIGILQNFLSPFSNVYLGFLCLYLHIFN